MPRFPFRPVLLAVFGLAGLTTAAVAQPASSCLALTDAMGLAAARAPEVAGAQARLAQAEAEARAARSLRRPQVSTFGRSSVGDTGLTSSQIENQVGVQVSQRIYDFGDARLAETAARNQVDQRTYEIEAQQAESAQMLADAYLTRLETLAVMDVVSERRDYYGRQRDAVTDLLARGGATRADRAQIEAQLANAEADALELQFLAEQSATRIREYAGVVVGELCDDAQAAADLSGQMSGLGTLDSLVRAALSENPMIGARLSAVRSLEARLDRARRNRLPVIEAVGIASYVYDDQREDWEGRDRLGVDVSVPLYTGQALAAERDQAAAQLEAERSALRTLQRNMREEAEIAFRRSISLEAQLIRREAVAASQAEYFEAIEGEFEYGLGTLPDLVDARLAHEQAQIDVISARFDWLRQKLELLRLTGRTPTAATGD
jgi:outer membrane protein